MKGIKGQRFAWEREIGASDLPPTTRLVALALATFMNADGTKGHPGQQRLARFCGLSERSVRAHLAELLRLGWLIEVEHGSGPGHASVYKTGTTVPPFDEANRNEETVKPEIEVRETGTPLPPTNHLSPTNLHQGEKTAEKEDRILTRAVNHFGPRGYKIEQVTQTLEGLRNANHADELIDIALGQCEQAEARKLAYWIKVTESFHAQRDPGFA